MITDTNKQSRNVAGILITLVEIAVVAFLYYITGVLGIFFGGSLPPGIITAVWPPSGIALAAVLFFGYKVLPGIFLGSLINNFLFLSTTEVVFSNALMVGIGTGFGASLQAWLGAFLIRHYIGTRMPFERAKDSFKFLIFALLSCIVNATIGPLITCLNHFAEWQSYPTLWWTWWLGDTTGILIFTPLLLSWIYFPIRKLKVQHLIEGILILITGLVLEKIIFRVDVAFLYLLILIPIWAVFRLGLQAGTLAVLVIVVPSIWDTFRGMGPFHEPTLNTSLLMLQEFMGVSAGITLVVAGVLSERARARRLLEISNQELESKVKSAPRN